MACLEGLGTGANLRAPTGPRVCTPKSWHLTGLARCHPRARHEKARLPEKQYLLFPDSHAPAESLSPRRPEMGGAALTATWFIQNWV